MGSVASIFLFTVFPTNLFIAGAALVIGAVVLYGVFPYRQRSGTRAAKQAEEAGVESGVGGGEKVQLNGDLVQEEGEDDEFVEKDKSQPKPA